MSQALSVIIFRIVLEGIESYQNDPEDEDRAATEAARKLLPLLRAKLSKEAKCSINGPGIMTVVIRAEQQVAESVAKHIQKMVQATSLRVGTTGRWVNVVMTYSLLTFPLQAQKGSMTVNRTQVYETARVVQTHS
jgi:hypothetical protein